MSDPDSPLLWLAITCVFVLAGFVKGVIGVGLPTVVMGLLGGIIAGRRIGIAAVLRLSHEYLHIAAGPSFVPMVPLWTICSDMRGTWEGPAGGGRHADRPARPGCDLALTAAWASTLKVSCSRAQSPGVPVHGFLTGL